MATVSLQNTSHFLGYYLNQFWYDIQDPRTKDFFLVDGPPFRILSVLGFYLYFACFLGPRLMANRPPFDNLKPVIFVYNFSLAISNAFFVYLIILNFNYGRRFLDWHYPDRSDTSPQTLWELSMGWWYWMTKFLDLFDTVFFVLRKKFNNLSFLHLYHHTSVPIFGYLSLKMNAIAPVNGLFGLVNGLVHVVMYTYYGLSSLDMKPYLWWKRYITQLQLGQFVLYFLYGVVLLFKQTGYPLIFLWIGFSQVGLFFYLFYNFYKSTYPQKEIKEKKSIE